VVIETSGKVQSGFLSLKLLRDFVIGSSTGNKERRRTPWHTEQFALYLLANASLLCTHVYPI